RVVMGWLVLGRVGMAVVGIAPAVLAEWTPMGDGWTSYTASATAPGAWVSLCLLALVLVTALWDRLSTEAVVGLLVLTLTIPLLAAGAFAGDRASASAARWGLGVCFVLGSSALWFRNFLPRFSTSMGLRIDGSIRLAKSARLVLLGAAAGPVLALTLIVASLQIAGEPLGGPAAASFFARLGPLASALIPLLLVTLGVVGHAIRERS